MYTELEHFVFKSNEETFLLNFPLATIWYSGAHHSVPFLYTTWKRRSLWEKYQIEARIILKLGWSKLGFATKE